MYKTILTPLDGTRESETILPQVEALAELCQAKIVLLQVIEPPPPHVAAMATEALKEGIAHRTAEVQQYIHNVEERLRQKGLSAHGIVRQGGVVETILAVARESRADLIAMASHGYRGLARLLHGSVAAELLHRASLPLLILRAGEQKT
ncbi:MAG: universal stress protein [Caldilinea sp.]|nr:universal stress protein [Caldilinea sp.]MDW8441386.1 universal stress protein [Caldilineaceae bacterium]